MKAFLIRNSKFLILILIVFLAAFLRFWQLGKVPISPDWDEVSLGYNAYSILKTGRDEYGEWFPLFLRSFGDYKPALYVYLVIPAIKVFGLNVFAVRFPSALLGTLAVLAVYYLVNELFDIPPPRRSRQAPPPRCLDRFLPLVASLLLAISPWHLQFSRAAFESSVSMFFNILAVLFFLKGLKKPWFLTLSAFLAGLNIYAYQAEKVFTPLLVLSLVLIWRRRLLRLPRRFLIATFLIGLVVVFPFIHRVLTTPDIFLRARGTSFASDQTPFLARTVEKLQRNQQKNDFLGLILDNRRITYLITFTNSYLSHFDLDWLFIRGDDTRHHAPGMGLLYLGELPFFFWGIYSLIFDKKNLKAKLLLFVWFFLAPLPAAFTSGTPHAVRALRFLPVMQIFSALGIISFWELIKGQKKVFRFLICVFCFLFLIFNFAYYLNQYFVQLNYFTSQSWQYGYEPAIKKIKEVEDQYEKIIVSSQPPLDQSYIFFLFYLKYDPVAYQKEGGTDFGFMAEEKNTFDKYHFRPIKWPEEERSGNILYVGRPNDFPTGRINLLEEINFLNGQPVIKIVEG